MPPPMGSTSKSVRFAAGDKPINNHNKRSRSTNMEDETPSPAALAKKYRPNPDDELDDVDEYTPDDDNDDDDKDTLVLPSEKELLEAKRIRRQKAAHMEDSESTHIDDRTSLAKEGVVIEPFHMEQERSDGSGYFDGDTYVFRKRNPDEEPDAWLEQVQGEEDDDDEGNNEAPSFKVMAAAAASGKEQPETQEPAIDSWTKEQLYSQILPLVSDTETVMQAVRRYGFLIKQQQQQQKKANSKNKTGNGEDTDNHNHNHNFAKTSLDDLTGAANALLFKGDVDIYDTTRNDIILKKLPTQAPVVDVPKQPPATWEYMGDQDGQLHGPYTTEQMIGWTQAGYFVGGQQVQIRTIREPELSTKDEMLADLMDDDEEEANGEEANVIKGEWMSSNDVVFTAYLP